MGALAAIRNAVVYGWGAGSPHPRGGALPVAPAPDPASDLRRIAADLEADIARRPHPWALAPVAAQDAVNAALRRLDAANGTMLAATHRARGRVLPGDPARQDPPDGVNRRLLLAAVRRALLACDDRPAS
jgi:hypothetical protein